MKHKTSELEGYNLDLAVFMALGHEGAIDFKPSENWAQGGPIIEREGIECSRFEGWYANVRPRWNDHLDRDESDGYGEGETLLIAAMRAYVASKFGDEVEL